MVGSFIYVPSNSVFIALSDYTINCDPNPSQEPHEHTSELLIEEVCKNKTAYLRLVLWCVCFLLLLLFLLSLLLVDVVYATETLFQHHHQHHHQVVENGK